MDGETTLPTGGHGSKFIGWAAGGVCGLVGSLLLGVFGFTFNTTFQNARQITGMESDLAHIRQNLDQVNRKLDRLLERK